MRKRIRTVGPIVAIVVAICIGAAVALRGQPDVVPLAGLSAPRWLERIYNRMPGNVPQMDDTDKQAVSIYGTDSGAGDTEISVDASGNVQVDIVQVSGKTIDFDSTRSNTPLNMPWGNNRTLEDGKSNTFIVPAGRSNAFIDQVVGPYLFNGTLWDRQRNNEEITVLASAGRAATTSSSSMTNYNNSGMVLFVDVTARDGTTSIEPSIQIQDPIGNEWLTIWTAAAVISSSNTSLVYSFSPYSANTDAASLYTEGVELVLPRTWRVAVTHDDSVTVTYSIAASMIP